MEIIYGRNAVTEALKAAPLQPKIFSKLYLADGQDYKERGGPIAHILELLAQPYLQATPIVKVPRMQLDKLTNGANHQGVAAEVTPYRYADFADFLQLAQVQDSCLFLVLDYLQDPQNLGTLLRTAEATGVNGVILPERRAAGITPAVRNSSSGAVEWLKITQVVNLARALEQLKEAGVWVAGLEDEAKATPYDQADYKGRLALVVGAEGPGLGRLIREKCDFFVKLPMLGQIASLNAAVAGSIALYEARRQRQP